jgi:hypothetical protein
VLVKAAPGLKCPQADRPREYITDSEPAEVPDSAYYLRLVADGSLVTVSGKGTGKSRERGTK